MAAKIHVSSACNSQATNTAPLGAEKEALPGAQREDKVEMLLAHGDHQDPWLLDTPCHFQLFPLDPCF